MENSLFLTLKDCLKLSLSLSSSLSSENSVSFSKSAFKGYLAPGFRFHPTDEELVSYYLKRKICARPCRFDPINDVDVYKSEPWDLPGKSRLKSRDLEWYFFSALDKKYGNGSRTNRATERGYWKTTGKDRAVFHMSRTVGMKKTLVYHIGRAPRGERTNWVMHEYRLVDEGLEIPGIVQDAFVLCRIFQKSGSGPKNGEQYGAPFVEEEWEDEFVIVPGDDACPDGYELEQILGGEIPSGVVPLPSSNSYGVPNSISSQKPLDFVDDAQKLLVSMGESYCAPEQPEDAFSAKHEYVGESSNTVNSVVTDYLVDEPFFDVTNHQFDDESFIETGDLSNHFKTEDPSDLDMLDEYLTYFDADDGYSQYIPFDSSYMIGSENLVSEQSFLTQQHFINGEAQQETNVTMGSQQFSQGLDNDFASSSKQDQQETNITMGSQQFSQGLDNDFASSSKRDLGKSGSGEDTEHPFIKRANRMLGSINAPPAFASEFPTKEAAALLLNPASHSSGPVRVTTGLFQIGDMALSGGSGAYWSVDKNGNVNIVLSFGMLPNNSNSAKAVGSAVSRGRFYLFFVWGLILSTSLKIGSYFYTGRAA